MAVRIRLSRFGRLHRPYFRIVACDKRVHREGIANEVLGFYEPLKDKQNLQVDADKLKAWVAQGAQISEALSSLLRHAGYEVPVTGTGARAATVKAREARPKKDNKRFVPASRRSKLKHAAKLKLARKAAAAAAAPAADSKPAEAGA